MCYLNIKRGDIFYADLRPVVGSEQGGVRPVLIVQNDTGNRHSPTVIIAAITSRMKHKLPTHVEIDSKRYDMIKDSVILLEQLRTIDKARLKDKLGFTINPYTLVNNALRCKKSGSLQFKGELLEEATSKLIRDNSALSYDKFDTLY